MKCIIWSGELLAVPLMTWVFFFPICSSFKENDGNNGIFIIAYTPLLFGGTTQFIGNNGSDALRV